MARWLEVDGDGALTVPPEVLGPVKRHTRYSAEQHGDVLLLRPERGEPFWASATPEQRAARFRRWVGTHWGGPGLPAEALRRENFYD
ncbi:MAG: hypothetical protein AAB225_04935 [Acidobacteriota bacterium]